MKRLNKIILLLSAAAVFTGPFISAGTAAAFAERMRTDRIVPVLPVRTPGDPCFRGVPASRIPPVFPDSRIFPVSPVASESGFSPAPSVSPASSISPASSVTPFSSVSLVSPVPVFPEAPQNSRLYPDGPYLLYTPSGLRFIRVDGRGKLTDTLYRRGEGGILTGRANEMGKGSPFSFDVVNDGRTRSFRVTLHGFTREEAVQPEKGKMFVISDPHSDLESFLSVLIRGNVIDRDLNWIYGDNRLLVLGDVADRGTDAVAIYWLIYKLEEEAARQGGKVHLLYGNHEGMVLQDNYKYTNRKYTRLADTLGMRWSALMGPDSELGRWLSSKNTIQIIGRTLFVHGGISPALADSGLPAEKINRLVSENIRLDKKERENASREVRLLLGSEGPLWFRGLVSDQEKYHPVSEQELDKILEQYNVDRIVVGHTTFEGVQMLYGGKVIAVDSRDKDRGRSHLAQGIEIENGKIRVVD